MAWGRNNESTALERYKSEIGHKDIVVTQLGLWISPDHPFLCASPDAAAYDPLELLPFGFIEIKCPHKYKNVHPYEAATDPTFCCKLVTDNGKGNQAEREPRVLPASADGCWAENLV